jgi:copper chaperone CopZ
MKDVRTDTTSATVSYDEKRLSRDAIVEEILSIGYGVPE